MIGALMIIFSSVMVASHIAQGADSDVRAISAVRSIFEHTKNMIECYSLPAGEILCRLDRALFTDCGYMSATPPKSFEGLAQNASISDAETSDLLCSFAKDFGKGYRADELSRCSLYIEKARAREQKLMKESAKKKRVIFTVAICLSLAVIILVI